MMRSDLALYLVVGVLRILLLVLPRWLWRIGKTAPVAPKPARSRRHPKPFAGYICKPECELCDQGIDAHPQVPNAPPPCMIFTRGRRRQVDTTGHFCPQTTCSYHGWVDCETRCHIFSLKFSAIAPSSGWTTAATGVAAKRPAGLDDDSESRSVA